MELVRSAPHIRGVAQSCPWLGLLGVSPCIRALGQCCPCLGLVRAVPHIRAVAALQILTLRVIRVGPPLMPVSLAHSAYRLCPLSLLFPSALRLLLSVCLPNLLQLTLWGSLPLACCLLWLRHFTRLVMLSMLCLMLSLLCLTLSLLALCLLLFSWQCYVWRYSGIAAAAVSSCSSTWAKRCAPCLRNPWMQLSESMCKGSAGLL